MATAGFERGLLEGDGMLARRWLRWLLGTTAAFLLWVVPTALVVQGATFPGLRLLANLGLVLCAASACFALAAAFLRFAGRHRPVFESLADNSYGIYLVHYVFVIWLQYLLLHAPLFAVAKAAIVFTGTLTPLGSTFFSFTVTRSGAPKAAIRAPPPRSPSKLPDIRGAGSPCPSPDGPRAP